MSLIQLAPLTAIAREHVYRHQQWIEATLRLPLSEALQLRIKGLELVKLAAPHVLPKTLPWDTCQLGHSAFSAKVRRVSTPPNVLPSLTIQKLSNNLAAQGEPEFIWKTKWQDCPVALHFEGMQHPAIFINVPHQSIYEGSSWREVTLVRRDSVEELLALIEKCQASYHLPSMRYFGVSEPTAVAPATWSDVVLDETATRLLRHDFESFFQRRAWFRANRLPFRRGYLLHGPPGNGKTSVIRAMLSHPGISGFAANLVTSEMDDDRLQAFFRNATENTPALVVLEDIDRLFFGLDKNEKSNVSLQQLLNCLDGVSTQDGMIVVATANHPEVLDTAILRRPGRFDRVIEFGNPTKELRSTYLQKMCPALVGEALDICAIASEGLSFAQLRESYILAGQTAFEEERDVTANDLTNAIQLLQATMNKADRKRMQKSGFDLQDSTQRKYARSCLHDR
jgi:hypothetical protein